MKVTIKSKKHPKFGCFSFLLKDLQIFKQIVEGYAHHGDDGADEAGLELSPYRISDGLTLIARDGIGPVRHRSGEAVDPSDVCLGNLADVVHSVYLMGDGVAAVSVLDQVGKHLVSTGCEAEVDKSVDIGRNAVLPYTESLGTDLIKLNICIKECQVKSTAQ